MAEWDESMVREGCFCGHGQYQHNTNLSFGFGRCRRCACEKFNRDNRGDKHVVEAGGQRV